MIMSVDMFGEWFDEMLARKDVDSCTTIINALLEHNQQYEANKLLDKLIQCI